MSEPKNLTIDLDEARNATAFSDGALLFPDRLEQVRVMVEAHLKRIPRDRPDAGNFNDHSSIFVDGARGAGKTSFALTLKDRLDPESGPVTWNIAKDVHVLHTLDPTLLEEQEVFLAQVVANVLSGLERRLEEPGRQDTRDADWKAIEGPLSKLARSFRVLLPEGSNRAWERVVSDPDLLGDELLSAAMSGIHLAERMHEFLVTATNVMGVKAFVLPIDDVDTAVGQGWPVLETTRKYLSSNRMITVLTGDLRLYRMLVRDQQWKKFGKLVEAERGIDSALGRSVTEGHILGYSRQVDLLVDQYLLKVLPPTLRVHLPGARERITTLDGYFDSVTFVVPAGRSEGSTGPDSRPLTEVLNNAWRVLFARPRKLEQRDVLNPMTFPPARLLSSNLRKLNRGLDALVGVALAKSNDLEALEDARETVRRFAAVYDSELTVLGIDRGLIDSLMEGVGGVRLATWAHRLVRRHPEAWRLDTRSLDETPEDEAIATTLLLLQAALNLHLQRRPLQVFQLLGRLLVPGQYRTMVDNNAGDRPDDWLANLHLQSNEPAWMVPARVVNPSVQELGGTLRLGQLRLPRRLNKVHRLRTLALTYGRSLKKIDRERIGFLPWWTITSQDGHKPDAYEVLPATETFHRRAGGRSALVLNWFTVRYTVFAQPYDVLDFWAGIAKLGDLGTDKRVWSKPAVVLREFARAAEDNPIYQKGQPPVAAESGLGDEDSTDDAKHWSSGLADDDAFVVAIESWLKCVTDGDSPGVIDGYQLVLPMPVMGDIVRRTYGAVTKITDEMENDSWRISAGAVLELWVAAWLQSILVGEAQYRAFWPGDGALDARGIAGATDVLEGNLTKLLHASELRSRDLPFFYVNLACPILLAAMGRDLQILALKLLNKVSTEPLWKELVATLSRDLFEVSWDAVEKDRQWKSSIHQQLCALVPAPSKDKKGARNITTEQYETAKGASGFDWDEYFTNKSGANQSDDTHPRAPTGLDGDTVDDEQPET